MMNCCCLKQSCTHVCSSCMQQVIDARIKEKSWIRKFLSIAAFSIFLLWLSPLVVSVLTFGSCLLLNINLTAGRVFTAIATFRILQVPLRQFPQNMTQVAQALVALKRLITFFQSGEVDLMAVERIEGGAADFAVAVHVSFKHLLVTFSFHGFWLGINELDT